jgi:pimeloyl-ACP methyl ester carboxylesterase
MAADTRAVLDALAIPSATLVGWSDGAATSLVLARETPERVCGVYFFGCNVDATGALPFVPTPVIDRIYAHHVREYAALSPAPGAFEAMRDDLGVMQADQPGYGADVLAAIGVPVWSVIAEHDEFIRREHAEYLAEALAQGSFHLLPGVSHFAPMQNPALFNASMLQFLSTILPA